MKRFELLFIVSVLVITGILAQTPSQFKYQAVLRDANGNVLADQAVTVAISILQASTTGTSIFSETHSVTTTAQGLINLNIGSINDMSSIEWGADTYFVEITVDDITMGTNQLLSVPYALHAKTVESITETDPIYGSSVANDISETDTINWNNKLNIEIDGSITNEIQNLSSVLIQGKDAGNQNIINLADPVSSQDAATKAYVDLLKARIEALELAQLQPTDFDGNKYQIIKIGDQIWMAENLKTTHYADGTSIPLITDNTAWGNLGNNNIDKAYCYYNNSDANKDIYGTLYTYAAATNGDYDGATQGVCPTGWHLPSDAEWAELSDYLGGYSIAGGKLKETGTIHWNSPNTGATNESGFFALPGGDRADISGIFYDFGLNSKWWSSTVGSEITAYIRDLQYSYSGIGRGDSNKSFGYYVRCIKDN